MAIVASIDPVNRRIYLSPDTVNTAVHPVDIYKEVRTLRFSDESLRPFDLFLRADGNISKGGGKFTERYVTLLGGTRIVPFDTSHTLTIIGTLITDDGAEGVAGFDKSLLSPGVSVDLVYQPPQVEIITVNTGSGVTPQDVSDIATATQQKILGTEVFP